MTLNRRYDEAVQYLPQSPPDGSELDHARSELGIDLMRLGQDQEAYQQLKTCLE